MVVYTYFYETEQKYAVNGITNAQNISATPQHITYTAFNKVETITEGTKTAEFIYNADRQRIRMTLKTGGAVTKTRWYFGSSFEREQAGSTVTQYIWIGGDAYTAKEVAKKTGTASWMIYNIFRDHLGTITHLKTGSTITEYSFDAWGRRRDKDTWTYTLSSEPALFADLGFTAQEFLPDFNLYNMLSAAKSRCSSGNGRLYDPVVGRFLSPDPYVQAPGFTQSYNRYSYCLNNPLLYFDPTGEKWKWKWLSPFYWFSEGMQWINDNTTGVRQKMVNAGVPDFSIGASVNGDGNVNVKGSYRGEEVLNTGNVDRSNALKKVNQVINDVRQAYDPYRYAKETYYGGMALGTMLYFADGPGIGPGDLSGAIYQTSTIATASIMYLSAYTYLKLSGTTTSRGTPFDWSFDPEINRLQNDKYYPPGSNPPKWFWPSIGAAGAYELYKNWPKPNIPEPIQPIDNIYVAPRPIYIYPSY